MSHKLTKDDKTIQRTNSRRQFIVKAAVGSAALSVPGKSVWGACSVSGAMSGNVSRVNPEQKCEAPPISGGRSPGTWKDALDGSMNGQRLKAMFTALQKVDYPAMPAAEPGSILWVAYESHLESVIKSNSMKIDKRVLDDDVSYANGGVPLFDALDKPGGMDYNLAAVWLNTYFGFYPSVVHYSASASDRILKANELVNNIAIYLFSESRIALASPEILGGTQTVSFSYNFESGSSSEYTLSQLEHNEYNRTTPFGLTEDNALGEDPGNGNGNGNGKGKGKGNRK